MSTISVDTANCYDRIHHIIMTLIFLVVGVQTGAIVAIRCSVKLMECFCVQIGANQSGLLEGIFYAFYMGCIRAMELLLLHD